MAFFLVVPAFGLGDKEKGEYEPAQGLENWQYKYDITGYKEGKYNLVIKGTDKAGNAAYAGPFDIFIDPKSAIPIVEIRNPAPGNKVGSRINILGTALDDKSIKLVEIKIDDGEYNAADGKEYWSFYANLDALPDGRHTVTARCTDVDDNVSPERSVFFHLDKKAPDTKITSLPNGTLVAGEIRIEGTVTELNGLKSLLASTDGKKHYTPINVTYRNDQQKYFFEFRIDTRKVSDGPLVIWFKGTDELGVVGYSAFLLFVNNESPVLEILYPADNTQVNGVVKVGGSVKDKVGVKSLTYEYGGGKKGEINVSPGNPFWIEDFDLSAQRSGTVEIAVTAENYTGIKQRKTIRLRVDEEQDRPVAAIAFPPNNAPAGTEVTVSGFVRDDDAVKSITYTLDKAAPITLECATNFSFRLTDLATGRHTVSVKPTDINGVTGKQVEIAFTVTGPSPSAIVTALAIEKNEVPFNPGFLFTPPEKGRSVLRGRISFPNGVEKAEYRIGDEPAKYQGLELRKGDSESSRTFEIELRKEIPEGRNNISIVAYDRSKLSAEYTTFFYKANVSDGPGVFFMDARSRNASGILITRDTELLGFYYDPDLSTIRSVETVPALENVSVDKNENTIIVKFAKPGTGTAQVRVTGTTGKTATSDRFTFVTDTAGPEIKVKRPLAGDWIGSAIEIDLEANDPSGVKSIEYALKDPSLLLSLPVSAAAGGAAPSASATIKTQVPIKEIEDGNVLLTIKATDAANNVSYSYIPLLKDTKQPTINLVAPLAKDELHGFATIFGFVEDAGTLGGIEFTDDNKTFVKIGTGNFFAYDISLTKYAAGIPKELGIRATDLCANASVINPKLTINLVAVKPRVEIQIPSSGEVVRDNFIITGMAFDDVGVKQILFSIDGKEFQQIEGTNNFSIPVILESLSDAPHTVEVKAVNVNGIQSDIAKSSFVVSKAEPESKLLSPKITDFVRGIVEFKGASTDLNGIKEVFVSYDNGLTFNRANGTEQWSYRFNTELLADGIRSIFVKAVDKADTEGFFNTTINIDNHPPAIKLDSPIEGDIVTQSLVLDGKASDNLGLSSLELEISTVPQNEMSFEPAAKTTTTAGKTDATKATVQPAVTGSTTQVKVLKEPIELASQLSGIFNRKVDISKLPAGWYNVVLTATDKADNVTYLSKIVLVRDTVDAGKVELLFPAKGETVSGLFTLSGRVISHTQIDKVTIVIDNKVFGLAEVNNHGYFNRPMSPDEIAAGDHVIRIEALFPGNARVLSEDAKITYTRSGPWVSVTNLTTGDFVSGRPFIEGKAGFFLDPVGEENREAFDAYRKQLEETRVTAVSLSFDNGRSFLPVNGLAEWKYRLEAYKLPQGELRPIIRAEFADNSTALAKLLLEVDNKAPDIAVTAPEEGSKYNESLLVSGTAEDANGLTEIAVSLRQGDKWQYQLPSFVQGMYIDAHALGGTDWETGLGFTFFDENIKLEGLVGYAPYSATNTRFTGLVLGGKLIANIASLPFGYFFGPDWEFFSMSLGVGACFNYFTNNTETSVNVPLSMIIGQVEFAKFTIPGWKIFKSYSFYYEFQAWMISSDVDPGIKPLHAFGFRLGIF